MKQPKDKKPRSQKVSDRAEKKMGKARASWTKAEQAKKDSQGVGSSRSALHPSTSKSNMESYANKMYSKAGVQEKKAKELRAKSDRLKAIEAAKKLRK